ncbi:MAG: hypothetical protein ACR2LC_06805 [Pyrinomonadaceae bacterium]
MSEVIKQTAPEFGRLQGYALIAGISGLALCGVGWFVNAEQFFRSYLVAFVFWTGLALGCLGILMLQYLTGGAWGIIIRRALEAATGTLPLMALLFVPLIFGIHHLYIWSHPADFVADEVLHKILLHKQPYLNTPFFIARACLYFILWAGTGFLLNRWSLERDRTNDARFTLRLQALSGPGLFVLALTLTFAMIDWVMSLEPRWYSTIYGVTFIAGETLAGFAFIIAIFILLARYKPLADVLRPRHYRDLGNLLLAFVMLWAYCAFSQFLLIWSGNLREETPWYLRRTAGVWGWVSIALIALHFFLPFFLLLSGDVKRNARRLAIVAGVVILMRFVDVIWLVEPAFPQTHWTLHWMDFVAMLGTGGVWLWLFFQRLKGRPLLPVNDPYMREALSDEPE